LLYYAQGWSVTWRQTPLFTDKPVEAWKHGPVVDVVYQTYKDYGAQQITEPRDGDSSHLDQDERGLLGAVIHRYGSLSGPALRRLTHEDDAWDDAWKRRTAEGRGRQHIQPEAIAGSLRQASLLDPDPDDVDEELVLRVASGDGDALAELLGADN
jgi:uncharacterized phage-associated protein